MAEHTKSAAPQSFRSRPFRMTVRPMRLYGTRTNPLCEPPARFNFSAVFIIAFSSQYPLLLGFPAPRGIFRSFPFLGMGRVLRARYTLFFKVRDYESILRSVCSTSARYALCKR